MKIYMPFKPKWKDKLLNGEKVSTCRYSRYGEVGDEFEAFGATFYLMGVDRIKLQRVKDFLYKEEGCDSPEEFEAIWNEIHPHKKYQPYHYVWFHEFALREEE